MLIPRLAVGQAGQAFSGGRFERVIPFVGEGVVPLDEVIGEELDGRLFTDLSTLHPGGTTIPIDRFYVRTRVSDLLPALNKWSISITAPDGTLRLATNDLVALAKSQGLQLMECSGNSRGAHFGMIGVTSWTGIPIRDLLNAAVWDPSHIRVLVSGFDSYSSDSRTSVPGASWVFLLKDLYKSQAFLAFNMGGKRLTADHGAPVRLVVPGCYGCCCIKWVNEIRVVPDDVPATLQMREYASRTHQAGIPELARDYDYPVIDAAAMSVRVERWLLKNRPAYLVAGIVWGCGHEQVRRLEVRFNAEEAYVPVSHLYPSSENPWRFWWHRWMPPRKGNYRIQLRIAGPNLRTRRLDAGFYTRSVSIDTVS
jgi:hypothetical protein